MLSLPLWHAAETKILAGLSWVMWPAELIEMTQYSPFSKAFSCLDSYVIIWLTVHKASNA